MIKDSYVCLLIMKYVTGTLTNAEAVKLAKWVSVSSENKKLFKDEIQKVSSLGNSSADAAEFWSVFKERNIKEFEGIKKRKTLSRRGILAGAVSIAAVMMTAVLLWSGKSSATDGEVEHPVANVSEETQIQVAVPSKAIRTQTVYTAKAGEISRVVLPDGTKVILNSDSKLTLSATFNKNAREV